MKTQIDLSKDSRENVKNLEFLMKLGKEDIFVNLPKRSV